MGESGDLRPALDEAIVGKRFCCAIFGIAEGVEAVGQLAADLDPNAELADEVGRCTFTAALEHTDQAVDDLPRCEIRVRCGVPVFGQFMGLE